MLNRRSSGACVEHEPRCQPVATQVKACVKAAKEGVEYSPGGAVQQENAPSPALDTQLSPEEEAATRLERRSLAGPHSAASWSGALGLCVVAALLLAAASRVFKRRRARSGMRTE